MTPRQLLDLVRVDVCVCMFEWVCECVCVWELAACVLVYTCVWDYVHRKTVGLSGCVTHLKLIPQTYWPLVLKEKSDKDISTARNLVVTDLRFACTGLAGASRWLESEVRHKSGMVQDGGHLSINLHHFTDLWNTPTPDIIWIQCMSRRR